MKLPDHSKIAYEKPHAAPKKHNAFREEGGVGDGAVAG